MGYTMIRAPLVGDIVLGADGKRHVATRITALWYLSDFTCWQCQINDSACVVQFVERGVGTNPFIAHWKEVYIP